jgi:hypothetical protein
LRRARYAGLAKIKVQYLATATAIDLKRYVAWLEDTLTPRPRSPFAALAPAMVKVCVRQQSHSIRPENFHQALNGHAFW